MKNNPKRKQRDATMAQLRLEGKSVQDIAKICNVDKSTVSRALNDDEVKAVLESTTRHLARLTPRVFTNYELLTSEDMLGWDKKVFLEGTRDLAKILQIAPSPTSNTIIANIHNDNRTQIIDPNILQALSGYMEADEAEIVE